MRVEEPLIGTIKADASLSEGAQRMIVLHVRTQDHDSAIETVRPSNIRYRCKVGIQREKFVRSSKRDNITIEIDDATELCLAPELDLGESRN
jgi:hypothetical protein